MEEKAGGFFECRFAAARFAKIELREGVNHNDCESDAD